MDDSGETRLLLNRSHFLHHFIPCVDGIGAAMPFWQQCLIFVLIVTQLIWRGVKYDSIPMRAIISSR